MRFFICFLVVFLTACCTHRDKIICPKTELNGVHYCSVPFVEMQANYINLDNVMIEVEGVLSVMQDSIVLVEPHSKEYDLPKSNKVVEVYFDISKTDIESARKLHGKYVAIYGRFKAKNISKGEWSDLIAHGIEDAQVRESFP